MRLTSILVTSFVLTPTLFAQSPIEDAERHLKNIDKTCGSGCHNTTTTAPEVSFIQLFEWMIASTSLHQCYTNSNCYDANISESDAQQCLDNCAPVFTHNTNGGFFHAMMNKGIFADIFQKANKTFVDYNLQWKPMPIGNLTTNPFEERQYGLEFLDWSFQEMGNEFVNIAFLRNKNQLAEAGTCSNDFSQIQSLITDEPPFVVLDLQMHGCSQKGIYSNPDQCFAAMANNTAIANKHLGSKNVRTFVLRELPKGLNSSYWIRSSADGQYVSVGAGRIEDLATPNRFIKVDTGFSGESTGSKDPSVEDPRIEDPFKEPNSGDPRPKDPQNTPVELREDQTVENDVTINIPLEIDIEGSKGEEPVPSDGGDGIDPVFSPDNKYYAWPNMVCPLEPLSFIDEVGTKVEDSKCVNADVGFYTTMGLNAGDNFLLFGDYRSNPGRGIYDSIPISGFAAANGHNLSLASVDALLQGNKEDVHKFLIPGETDFMLSPSGEVILSRFAVFKEGVKNLQTDHESRYRIRGLYDSNGDLKPASVSDSLTLCFSGEKPMLSFDNRFLTFHHHSNQRNPQDFGTTTGVSNIYVIDMKEKRWARVTGLQGESRAYFPHFRADNWLYFLVKDPAHGERIVASNIAIIMKQEPLSFNSL